MNRRRELTLQRVSRIGGLSAVESIPQNTRFKKSTSGAFTTLTIEAALGAYMTKGEDMYRREDAYIPSYGDPKKNEQELISRQMDAYVSSAEESRLVNAKSQLEAKHAAEKMNIKKFEEALAKDPSAQYQLSRYKKKNNKSDYDALDANRCSGFLLYSYNKRGTHSVLGE